MFSGLLILLVVGLTVLLNPAEIASRLRLFWLPVLLVTPLLFAIGLGVAWAFQVGVAERRAVLFEVPCRNVALAMLISLSVLNRPDSVLSTIGFFMIETLVILGIALFLNQKSAELSKNW